MAEEQSTQIQETPCSVYRYYDKHGVLLYVGITGRGMARNGEHNKTKEWWQYVTRQEVDHHKSRKAAHNAEKDLIRKHRPPFNVQHNPDYAAARDTYLTFRNNHVPVDANSLLKRATSASQHRIYLDVAAVSGVDLVNLTSRPEDAVKVRSIDITECGRFDLASGGRGGKVVGFGIQGGLLHVMVRVRDAAKCGGAELMLSFGSHKGDPITIKRIDLYMPPRVNRRKTTSQIFTKAAK